MTQVRRVRGIAAILATLAGATLATAGQGDAHAATAPGSPESATRSGVVAQTAVHLHVTGCDHCTVQLQHAVNGNPTVWTSKTQRIGADHVATFQVKSALTQGMSFVLRAPWEGDTGAVSNIVTRYAGQQAGSTVTRAAARNASRATGCWAGTGGSDVRLDFHVSRVAGKTLNGQPTEIPLVYATSTLPSWKPMVRSYRGTIGNQDAFYCTKP